MDKQLLRVNTEKLYEVLPYVDKYIKPAYHTGIGEQSWESLLGRAFLGDVIFWLAFDDGVVVGAGSTEVIDFDGYRCVHVITSSTDTGNGFWDYHYAYEEYARQIGAKHVQFWGRKGWSRVVDKITGQTYGEKYKEVYRVFSMEIKYESDKDDVEPDHAPHEPLGSGSP
jgi:hypothetical protein